MSSFWEKLAQPLPDPSRQGRNASAIFGASPSFGLYPAETKPQFRPAPPKRVPEPKKVKRSNSDVALRKRSNPRRKSGDFSQVRKRSESESENHLNGVTCNGKTVSTSILCSGSKGSDCADTVADSVCSLPEQSQDPNDFSNRYPLFIQVNNGSQTASKARIVKPVGRASNQGSYKQDAAQDKQSVRPRRSASFSAPKKTATPSRPSQSSQPAQDTLKNGNLRREKSDIVRPRRTRSPSNRTAIPSPARSVSSSSLKQDNSLVSPRSQSPAGLRREHSDVTKRRAPPSVRREKSDIVRPRGQLRTNSPTVSNENLEGDISRSSSNRSLTSSPLSKSPSKSSIEGSRSRSGSSSEMSKIPSLVRSPASAGKTDSHVSRIPSLTKRNNSEERTPPKSRIPSSTKGDKAQEVAQKSQLPTAGRKDSASQKDKAASKIPSSAALSQNRPDSAKENKDPTAASVPNGHEPVKQVSKIPSFSKTGIPKSKIPSVARKDSRNEEHPALNGEGQTHSSVIRSPSDATKSKIPGVSSPPQGTGIPMGVSRIPSFTKSPSSIKTPESKQPSPGGSKSSEPDGPPANVSRIPTFPSTPPNRTPESKVPVPGGSKIPEPKVSTKSPPSSLPVASKASGIPKPGESRIPGYAGEKSTRKISSTEKETVATGSPVASSPVETKSKIPSLPKQTAISKPNGNEQTASKPRTGIPTLGGKRPSIDQDSPSQEEPATPPSTPIRENFSSESPLDKYIFTEAKKMEQLLRDEPIEVSVPAEDFDDDDEEEFLRQEKEIEEEEEKEHEKELHMLDSKEAEDLISEVLKSYAPDINKENQPELEEVSTVKDDNRNFKEMVNIDDIVPKPTKSENELPTKLEVKEEKVDNALSEIKVDSKEVKENGIAETRKIAEVQEEKAKKSEGKNNVPDLKIAIPTEKVVENEKEEKVEKEAPKSEGPAIDTLGEYAQQARRSRSRQRKIVSPDSEEPEKEFVAESVKEVEKELEKQTPKESENSTHKEQPKKDIKKDKYGTAPFESEKKPKEASKSAKSKLKSDKPKFLIESSLGKDFYATRKSNESMESRDSVHDDVVKSSFKPELSALVFENKVVEKPLTLKRTEVPSVEEAVSLEEAEFEDVDLRSEQALKNERREISRSVDTLDEKTVKCMCGRGGKCSIM
ncbi:titin-like isoform X2 [Orbicella faveolata]|uniref:titin-like isoform X2 n=1 Tax=Orbicella faveolata TaxID=48498 RepID=UPI0009E24D2F|nr:titin-like isoform X2 [Orbicella faveolata]